MEVEFELTTQDIKRASTYLAAHPIKRLGPSRSEIWWSWPDFFASLAGPALYILPMSLGIFIFILGIIHEGAALWYVQIVFLLLVLEPIVVFCLTIFYYSAKQSEAFSGYVADNPQHYQGQRIALTPSGLVASRPHRRDLLYWQGIEQIVATSNYVYFYTGRYEAVFVPRRAFVDETALLEFMAEAQRYRDEAQKALTGPLRSPDPSDKGEIAGPGESSTDVVEKREGVASPDQREKN